MKPISELTFEHGWVLLRTRYDMRRYAIGILCFNGRVAVVFHEEYPLDTFTHFLPLSEIAQLQESK